MNIKIIKIVSTSLPSYQDIRTSVQQHKIECTERCMAITEAGTRHLFFVAGNWVDASGQHYSKA